MYPDSLIVADTMENTTDIYFLPIMCPDSLIVGDTMENTTTKPSIVIGKSPHGHLPSPSSKPSKKEPSQSTDLLSAGLVRTCDPRNFPSIDSPSWNVAAGSQAFLATLS